MLIESCMTWIATSWPSAFTVSMVQHRVPLLRALKIGTIAAPMAISCRWPISPSHAVATPPTFEIVGAEGEVDNIDIAAADVARVEGGSVAHRHRHAMAARDLEQPGGVLDGAHDQRRAAQRILRIGEAELEIDHDDAGLLAGADRNGAVAAALVVVGHAISRFAGRRAGRRHGRRSRPCRR